MRSITHVGALTVALALSPLAIAQTPSAAPAAAAAKPQYDEDTPYGVLMRDPAAKAVLQADWPLLITAIEAGGVPETSTMRGALTNEAARTQGGLTDGLYEKIVSDLKRVQAASATKYDENTPFSVLMKDPAAKNVLIDDWPLVVTAIEMGGVEPTNTMKDAWNSESAHSKGGLTQALYDKVIADLKKL